MVRWGVGGGGGGEEVLIITLWDTTLTLSFHSGKSFLSHLLVAGCDIGVRLSVRPSVHPSVRPSVNIYVDVRHLCQS